MPVLSSAVTARNRLDEDIALGLSAAHWEWQQMTPYLDDSWARVGPRMTSLVTASQARTAERAPLEVAQMLDEQGLPFRTEGSVRPAALYRAHPLARGCRTEGRRTLPYTFAYLPYLKMLHIYLHKSTRCTTQGPHPCD